MEVSKLKHMGRNSFQNMIAPHKFLEQEKKIQNNYLQL